jgi:iron(III) transport system substrate-binding protein
MFHGLKILAGVLLLSTIAQAKTDLWIYTSLYKDTIADIQPQLEKQFPDIKFNFYQAGSEEVAAKVNAEELAGGVKADVLISSDRFWYEDLAKQKKLFAYKPKAASKVSGDLKSPEGFYTTLSLPVMVLAYNNEAVPDAKAPKSFKELGDPKWKGQASTGSPLASGTNFTTVAFLQKSYGWDYFKDLKKNEVISEGGNGAVIRRLQTKERPVGWVLLENILRFQDTDKRIKFVIPDDGAVIQNNIIAITQASKSKEAAQKFVEWMYGPEGQQAMIKSFMYSPLPGFAAPKGAPELKQVLAKAKPWSPALIREFMDDREKIKDNYSKIMFQ